MPTSGNAEKMGSSRIDIHPTAVVSEDAMLSDGVRVGPFAVVEGQVEVGAGTIIGPHAVVHTMVRLGARNRLHPHVTIGGVPQDVSFGDEETWLEIGDENLIREAVTIHRATRTDRPTRVGNGCFLMVNAHIAHDCQLGDGVVLTNDVNLGGHVEVGDGAILGGAAGVHQFVRIGSLAIVGGLAGVHKDILPFSLANGNPARHYRLNAVGLRRAGITGTRYRMIEEAFRRTRSGRDLEGLPDTPEVAHLRAWLATKSKRRLTGFAGPGKDRITGD